MNKEELTVTVVILKQIDFKDNDAIINAISEEGEYFSFFARGIRKPLSKNASSLQPFMKTQVIYFKNQKSLHLLKSAKVIENLYDFDDYQMMIAAHIILDVINDHASMNLSRNTSYYSLLFESLESIKIFDIRLVLSVFLIKMMKSQGITLISDCCSICSSKSVNYISVKHGGFICYECLDSNDVQVFDLEFLKLFRLVNSINFDNLQYLENDLKYSEILLSLITEFYITYSGFKIRNIKEFITI